MFEAVTERIRNAIGERSTGERSRVGRRVHADRDDDVVVFVVGMRINAVRKVHRWLPVLLAGPRLVRRLRADDQSGLLGSWTFVSPPRTVGFVQYWESFDALREYAHDADRGHSDAWREFRRRSQGGAVGIWHETYCVESYETVYSGVPPRGLGAADGSELVAASGELASATGRLASTGTADRRPAGGTDPPRPAGGAAGTAGGDDG